MFHNKYSITQKASSSANAIVLLKSNTLRFGVFAVCLGIDDVTAPVEDNMPCSIQRSSGGVGVSRTEISLDPLAPAADTLAIGPTFSTPPTVGGGTTGALLFWSMTARMTFSWRAEKGREFWCLNDGSSGICLYNQNNANAKDLTGTLQWVE